MIQHPQLENFEQLLETSRGAPGNRRAAFQDRRQAAVSGYAENWKTGSKAPSSAFTPSPARSIDACYPKKSDDEISEAGRGQDADSGEDAVESAFVLEARLTELRSTVRKCRIAFGQLCRSDAEEGRLLIRLEKMPEAWEIARAAFDIYIANEKLAGRGRGLRCDVCRRPADSLVALGQGIWLAVTFPVDPN